jgi:hypothetical protein
LGGGYDAAAGREPDEFGGVHAREATIIFSTTMDRFKLTLRRDPRIAVTVLDEVRHTASSQWKEGDHPGLGRRARAHDGEPGDAQGP